MPRPYKLTFDLLTLKVVSGVIFLRLSVLDLGPMYATDRQTSDAQHRSMPLPYGGGGIINACGKNDW